MVYNETGASLAELFHILLDPSAPAIHPVVRIRTTAEKLEQTVPSALLACVNPSGTPGERTGRGRPKKQMDDAGKSGRLVSSFAAFLYNGYNNAKARRKEMAEVFRLHPASVIKEAEEKAVRLLYTDGIRQFEPDRLRRALTADGCVPFSAQERRDAYRDELEYYFSVAPEKAFARAILALLLAEQAEACFELMFSAVDQSEDTPAAYARNAAALEARGLYKEAREAWRQILRSGGEQAADAAYEIGRMFRDGLGCRKDRNSAVASFEEANELCLPDAHPAASYALYDLLAEEGRYAEALVSLKRSANAGSADAVRELGNLFYRGDERYGISPDLNTAMQSYRQAAELEDPAAQRMLGILLEGAGNTEEAGYWFERAAGNGDEDAAYYWMQTGTVVHSAAKVQIRSPELAYDLNEEADERINWCFYNTDNEAARIFLCSLDDTWHLVRLPDANAEGGAEMLCGGRTMGFTLLENWPASREPGSRAVFFLFDEDTNRNLGDLIRFTGELNRLLAENGNAEQNRHLLEEIRLFVRCGEGDEAAAKIIDSCNAAHEFRRERCFQITLCDPVKDASVWLLTHQPLFLAQKFSRYRKTSVAILGSGRMAAQLVLDLLAVFPVERDGKPLSITVIDEHADEVRENLVLAAPALFSEHASEKLSVDVVFMSLSREAFFEKLEWNPERDAAWERKRFQWNYYIVAGEDDRNNLDCGVRLRETLTRIDLTVRPLIAVSVRSDMYAEQAARFSVLGERIGFSWYNQYELCCFGNVKQLYTAQTLLEDPIQRRAFALHAAYYGDTGNHLYDAAVDYWSRSYNRESSILSAMSAVYKLYQAGLESDPGIDFCDPSMLRSERPAELWAEWLSDPEHEEQAVRNEHIRWTYAVCSRGWRQASVEQMRRYIERGNPRQQLYLAKLHPCIVDWNRLRFVEETYNQLMRSRRPDWVNRDFIESDRIMVKNCWKMMQSEMA